MSVTDSQITDAPGDFDELEALRAAYNLPGEDQVDGDPIEAGTIPAGWGTARIVRHLKGLMRNPGQYTVSFAGRISHKKVQRIVAAVNKDYGVWEGGVEKGWDYEHDAGGRPMVLLESLHHGPYPSMRGETAPRGGPYPHSDSAKGSSAPETNRSAEAVPSSRGAAVPKPG